MKGVTLFLAEGFEQTEALATLDVLRRGGIEVCTISITDNEFVTSSEGVTVKADKIFSDFIKNYDPVNANHDDVMIFPGGLPGTNNLADKAELIDVMKTHYNNGGAIAAICAAPGLVVSKLDNVEGKKFTCYEGFQTEMLNKGAIYTAEKSVIDGRLITGKGPGLSIDFGLAILKYLKGEEKANEIKRGLMLIS